MTEVTRVKYFGLVAEKVGCKEENLIIEQEDLRSFFNNKYPKIRTLEYKIAINQQISDKRINNIKASEVALLPPFAGG